MDIERLGVDTDAALAVAPLVIVEGLFARRVTHSGPASASTSSSTSRRAT
ncbi:hypothetical protein ACIQ9P_31725 [Kitasatospora sp. NPDC094019]